MANTNIKYRLEFDSLLGSVWRLDIINVNGAYDDEEYPLMLEGSDNPLTISIRDNDEYVYSPIRGKSIAVELKNDGTFTVEEFAVADERTWFFKLYKDDELDFQGWLLPDQVNDVYISAGIPYNISLTATDGLGSLKGILYGLSDVNLQAVIIPDYGQLPIPTVLYNIFQAFGYDYGNTQLLSSMRYTDGTSNVFIANQWINTAMWNDLFYDENGIPKDAYNALEIVLKSQCLTITQEKGSFVIFHPNDLCYTLDGASQQTLLQSSVLFDPTFTTQMQGDLPGILKLGYQTAIKPIRPTQNWTFDNAYGQIKASVDFDLLALLYPNPSFEIAPVEGGIPVGLEKIGTTSIGLFNYGLEAYDGEWVLKVGPTGDDAYDERSYFRTANPQYRIESNKKVNVSFSWRPYLFNSPDKVNPVPAWCLILIGDSGQVYIYNANNGINYSKDTIGQWVIPLDDRYRQYVQQQIQDFSAYNTYSINTPSVPESGRIEFRIYGSLLYNYTNDLQKNIYYGRATNNHIPNQADIITVWDDLQITFDDATTPYSHQVGEVHLLYNKTQYAKTETQEPDLALYTAPNNKRFVGNVIYGLNIDTGKLDINEWRFALSEPNAITGHRLPEAMVLQIGKMYQKPLRIWEGTVLTDNVLMYAVWQVKNFESSQFMCLHYEHKVKQSEVDLVLREITDADFAYTYLYKPKFEKSARKVT